MTEQETMLEMRPRIEEAVSALLGLLDCLDAPAEDLEPDNEDKGVDDDGELAADDVGEPDYDNEFDYRGAPKPSYGIDHTQGGPGVYIMGKLAT